MSALYYATASVFRATSLIAAYTILHNEVSVSWVFVRMQVTVCNDYRTANSNGEPDGSGKLEGSAPDTCSEWPSGLGWDRAAAHTDIYGSRALWR